MRHLLSMAALIALITMPTLADTVQHGADKYEGVLVRETTRMLYLQVPSTGEIVHLRKDADPAPIWIPATEEQRAALQQQWDGTRREQGKAASSVQNQGARQPVPRAAASEPEDNGIPTLQLRGDLSQRTQPQKAAERSSGRVQSVRLRDVSLAQALDAMLRPMGLDYEVRGNVVFISTPTVLRQEAWAEMETRVYQVASQYETLPKIVLRNPFAQGAVGGGFGGGFQQQGVGGGFGGLGGGQQGFGNVGAGFGGGGFGQQGFGGQGGGGFGQQGGFNQGGLAPDVTQITNISDLFSNIDDRIVGESPAIVGGASLRALRGTTRR